MNKLFILSIVVASATSFAQTKSKEVCPVVPKGAKKIHCAVTHDEMDVAVATKKKMYADYKGKRYFFCCNGCPQAFKKNPEKYVAKAESLPTPVAVKKTAKTKAKS